MSDTEDQTHYVKLARGQWETVLFVGSKEEADTEASRLNAEYQTDEYYVEPHDPKKVFNYAAALKKVRRLLRERPQ